MPRVFDKNQLLETKFLRSVGWNPGKVNPNWINYEFDEVYVSLIILVITIEKQGIIDYKITSNNDTDLIVSRSEYHFTDRVVKIPIEKKLKDIRITTTTEKTWTGFQRFLIFVDDSK